MLLSVSISKGRLILFYEKKRRAAEAKEASGKAVALQRRITFNAPLRQSEGGTDAPIRPWYRRG